MIAWALAAQLAPFVMGNQLGERYAGVDTQIGFFDAGTTEIAVIDVDVVAEIPVAERLTFFGRLPVCWYHADIDPGENDTGTGLGNVTIGLRSRIVDRPERGGRTILGGVASLSIPTADGVAPVFAATAHPPPHEWGYYLPDATTLRLGGNVVVVRPRWFVQAEIALHAVFFGDEGGAINWNDDQVNLIRFGAAGGVRVGKHFAIVGELGLVSGLIEKDDGDEMLEGIDVGVRWKARGVTLAGRVWLPLDDEARDRDTFGLGFDLHAHF